MRVIVVVPDVDVHGGTFSFLESLLCIHARQGFFTSLLVPTYLCTPEFISLAECYGVEILKSLNRVLPATAPFLTPLYDFIFSWRAVRSWRPDLIVVSTSSPGRMSIALYYPVPTLYILHSTPEYRFRFLPRFYLRLGLMLNNMVMTVSRAAAESISSVMGLPKEKIAVVHNCCQSVEYRTDKHLPVVLTVGHVVDYKNPAVWLDVARMVLHARPDVSFVWVGDGELYYSMRSQVSALGLEARIILPGYVADPSVWYRTSQVYFQPSLRESHGIAVLEAMSYGLPCVVADIGGLPESVSDRENGYVCPVTDLDSFAVHIIELLDSPEMRDKMGDSGRLRAEKCFSKERQEQKILSVYRRLMNRAGEQ